MEKQLLNINGTATAESYPYGRLRTQAFFSIEFHPKKGFRSVFQTIDPKNGRVNKPKKSTYGRGLYYQYINPDNNHIETAAVNLDDTKNLALKAQRLAVLLPAVQATPDMIKYLAFTAYQHLVISMVWTCKENTYTDEIKAHFKPLMSLLKDMTNTGVNRWNEIDPATYQCPSEYAETLNHATAA